MIKYLMIVIYNNVIYCLRIIYRIAGWFNPKAKAFNLGQKQQKNKLETSFPLPTPEPLIWMHCASLGEFEQGRPVLEALKSQNSSLKILLTFFSPSGYEVRKNYEYADFIFYLPWDTRRNAITFIEKIKPALVIFVKYEFWYHYTHELHKRNIPLISISSIFRPKQIFFQWYGSLFRSMLKSFNHFFVQNDQSVRLLRSIDVSEVTLTGDTRFDRVQQINENAEELPLVAQFKNDQKLMVIGSAWAEDMEVLFPFINENKSRLKFIIAAHEISESFLDEIEKSIDGNCVRYSKAEGNSIQEFSVLLIDNIGMLSRLYRYGEFAFIGGGFRQGLHNILEAACYGIPIFFGNKAYQKYQEAVDLVNRGGAFEVGSYRDLKSTYEKMISSPQSSQLACEVTRQYVLENLGATNKIVGYCKKFLS